MNPSSQPVSSWGRLTRESHRVEALHDRSRLPRRRDDESTVLPFGNGRSYGDVGLNPGGSLWTARGLDRFIAFDPVTGLLECEAGVLLDEIIRIVLPQGWFLPVTPGTRFVTVGGAIANDVHGKNHHRAGSFGHHVLAMELARSDGERIHCGPQQRADWFAATVGGMGLTGLIVSVQLQLLRVPGEWVKCETLAYESLAEFFRLSREAEIGWDYVVSWIDCIHGAGDDARGILFRANPVAHAAPTPAARTRRVPITPPISLINAPSLRAFNSIYFQHHHARQRSQLQHLLPFFYPLDGLLEWNRIYGPRGFYQYQCVLPRAVEQAATAELLRNIRSAGKGSFLAVLKTFGERASAGMLSFPMPGTTLALDFANQGEATLRLFERLDVIVAEAGGRLYAAKDARMSAQLFSSGYPRAPEFLAYRDPGMSSSMSRRLFGY